MPDSSKVTRAAECGMLRATDVAAFLGVSRQRVDQLSCSDEFPEPRMAGHCRMWVRDEVEAWADERWWHRKPWRRF